MAGSDQTGIIQALRNVPVTKTEMTDLLRLYDSPSGVPYTIDVKNRPQADTIRRCRSVGRKMRNAVGQEHRYGVTQIGYCDPDTATWRMQPQFRALMRELGWAGGGGAGKTLIDEIDELDDADLLDEEAGVVAEEEERIRTSERISEADRYQLLRARLGAGKFRLAVQRFEKECRVTGLADRVLLQACHMKPWWSCSNSERLDGANGLLLAPGFHLLFSKGYISFDGDGRLLVSRTLPEHVVQAWPVKQTAEPRRFLKPQREYLEYHAKRVLKQ